MGMTAHCHASSNENVAAGATIFTAVCSSPRLRAGTTTEALVQLRYRAAGTFSKLLVNVLTNATTSASTVRFRKNGVDGTANVTIGAGATGTFEDTVNEDTVVSGDLVAMRVIAGTVGALGVRQIGMLYRSSSPDTVSKIGCVSFNGYSTASTTFFLPLVGGADADPEASQQLRMGTTYTTNFLSLQVATNARITATTVRLRKNGANGNQTFTVGAGATGLFEDTTNVDMVNAGDLLAFSFTTGTGTEAFEIVTWSLQFSGASPSTMWGNANNATTWAAGATEFLNPCGNMALKSTVETDVRMLTRLPVRLSQAYAYVKTNATTTASVLTLRRNGVDAAITMTIGAGATGSFTDLTNVAAFLSADFVNWKGVIGATGALTVTMLALLAEDQTLAAVVWSIPAMRVPTMM